MWRENRVTISTKRRPENYSRLLLAGAIWFFAITCAFVALGEATFAAQTYFKWDPDQTGTGSDDNGNWDASSTLWTAGSTDVKWANTVNSTNVASFGNGSGAAGTVTLTTAIWSDGLSFSAAGSGNYTIAAAAPADTLTLGAAVTVAPGLSPTISAPIAGSAGLMLCGGGNLTLAGANTYTGGTEIAAGTLTVAVGGSLGNVNYGFSLGTNNTATVGNLILQTSVTAGGISTNTNSATADTITIASGQMLTANGPLDIGNGSAVAAPLTNFTMTGGGNFSSTGSGNGVFVGRSIPVGGITTCDLSGLNSFTFNASSISSFDVGTLGQGQATVTLAATNSITVKEMSIGAGSTSGGGSGTLNLGSGSTTINAQTITVGADTSTGGIGWLNTTTTGSLNIANGSNRVTTITVGSRSEASAVTSSASLALDGHSINILDNSLVIGQSTGTASETASVAFDTGTFDVTSVSMSQQSSGTSISTFTLGSGPSSTGTLIVNSPSGPGGGFFFLASSSNGATSANCNGTFDIKGGTADINCGFFANTSAGDSANNATVILEGGTLNMMGHSIGNAGLTNNVTLTATSGTLENVSSINGTGGLTMGGSGSLTLAGTNAWTGPTSVSNGTMVLAANSTLGDTAITVASGEILDMMAGSSAGNTATASSGATLAGTTGGATFSLEDDQFGTFTLTQGSSFSGIALTLGGDTLDFDISNLGADEILDVGPGTASVSGTNIINMDALTLTLTPGFYTLISDPSGGLTGAFKFANLQTTETLEGYTLSLSNSSTAETLTVSSLPEPGATAAMALVAAGVLIRVRRRELPGAI